MNIFNWIRSKKEEHLFKMKVAGANNKKDVKLFLQVIEHEHKVYQDFIFMPGTSEYRTKLSAIGFCQVAKKDSYIAINDNFHYYYNDKLNLSVFLVANAQYWTALVKTIDVINAIKAVDTDVTAIGIIFDAIRTYEVQ